MGCGRDAADPPAAAAGSGGAPSSGGEGGTAGGSGGALGGWGGASGSAGDGGSGGGGAAILDLVVVKNGVRHPFERAQFGLSKLPMGYEVYAEAHSGGDAACPGEKSPTPARTAIMTGFLATDAAGEPIGYADGARANVLDFDGSITTEPILKATDVTVTPLPSHPCATCAAGDPARFVAFSIRAVLSDGAVLEGTVRAAHCGSLDE